MGLPPDQDQTPIPVPSFTGEGFAVFDNVLTPEQQSFVWSYIQNERLEFVHQNKWVKAFRLTDGQPLWGPPYLSDAYEPDTMNTVYPSCKGIDLVIKKVKTYAVTCHELIGKQHEKWAYFFARAYIYPARTGLSWHRDNENNATGAFVYYAHPFWDPQWGGEFLIGPLRTREAKFPETPLYEGGQKFIGSHLENNHEIEILMEEGRGAYIMPKPNRLVFMTAGVLHCIKKVEEAAGNKVRATIQGFFQDPARSKRG